MADNTSPSKKIVITGIGTVNAFGAGIDSFWKALSAGQSGVRRVERFDVDAYSCQVAAEAWGFDPTEYMDPKEVKRSDRYTHFAMAASRLALADAGFDYAAYDNPKRFGVLIGSGIGGMETIEQQTRRLFEGGPRKVSPFMIPSLISNIAGGMVAIEFGAKGPNYAVVSACASGTHALGDALTFLRNGDADVMLAGGAEASITHIGFAGFCNMKAMGTSRNDTPEKASCPFDSKRDGFIMGEGAGVLLLETEEHAKARGAKIYCELAGYGATCDAYHITSPAPTGEGLADCFERTLKSAGLKPEDVDYINAHGTSTQYNDKFETMAIKTVFGGHAKNLSVSSTKSMTGHLLGAAGGIEAAACAMAIKDGIVPPTINYDDPDPECDLDYTPNVAVKKDVNVAISDNLGFGGHNAAIAFKKYG